MIVLCRMLSVSFSMQGNSPVPFSSPAAILSILPVAMGLELSHAGVRDGDENLVMKP